MHGKTIDSRIKKMKKYLTSILFHSLEVSSNIERYWVASA